MARGIVNIPNSYTSDWSQGHGDNWCEVSPYEMGNPTLYTPHPPVGTFVNGEWVARYSIASGYGKIQTMPRFVLSAKDGFDVEIPITLNAACAVNGQQYYFAAALYNGEASYFGLYFYHIKGQGGHVNCINCGYGQFETAGSNNEFQVRAAGWWNKGDKVFVKIVCDAASSETRLYMRNETANPGGAYELTHTRHHEIMLATDPRIQGLGYGWGEEGVADFRWLEPCSLWLSGSSFAAARMEAAWNIDLHPITINKHGDGVVLGGAGAWYPWSRMWNPLPGGFDSWNEAVNPALLTWAQEASPEPEGMTGGTFWEDSESVGFLPSGSRTVVSPLISNAGHKLTKIRLYGRGTAPVGSGRLDGVLKVEVLDSELQPVSVGGVSEWHPDGGVFTPLEIDLSSAEMTEGHLRVTLDQVSDYEFPTYNLGWQYGTDITPLLFGFLVEGEELPPSYVYAAPRGGAYYGTQTITLAPANFTGSIYYTLDGSGPISNGAPYTGPIQITEPAILKVVGYDGSSYGNVQTYEYVIQPPLIGSFDSATVSLQPTVAPPSLSGQMRGSFTQPSVQIRPSITAAPLSGAQVGEFTQPPTQVRPIVSPSTLVGIQAGSFTHPSLQMHLSIAAPALTGVQVGSFAMPSVQARPQVSPPTLEATELGSFQMPAVSVVLLVNPPTLTGVANSGHSIRAPSGQTRDIRRIDGSPLQLRPIN